LSIDGNKVDFQTIYGAIKKEGLNNSSSFLGQFENSAKRADEDRTKAKKLLATGLKEAQDTQSPAEKDWKTFARNLITDLANIFGFPEEAKAATES
jgi:hypothetical protein